MRPLVAKLAVVALASAALAACAKLVGIDDLAVGACKGGVCVDDEGGSDADVADGALDGLADSSVDRFEGPCPGRGPPAEWVGANDNRFCIDTTEVTVKDYRELLAATDGGTNLKALGTIPPECQWKTTVAPGVGGPDDVPQTGVDWCDAYLYCRWAGKRLCGKSVGGKAAGSLATSDLPDFNTNQWLIACSLQGQLAFPYGSIRKPGACNLLDLDAGRALPVKQASGCVGGYPGLYDMVGNVWEWIDACRPRDAGADVDAGDAGPAKAECVVKGGSFATSPPSAVTCRVDGTGGTRDLRVNDVGFRCCSP
jgi:formylglycine-generating enzyme required for sulfatase activity